MASNGSKSHCSARESSNRAISFNCRLLKNVPKSLIIVNCSVAWRCEAKFIQILLKAHKKDDGSCLDEGAQCDAHHTPISCYSY